MSSFSELRSSFLAAARAVSVVLGSPEVETSWPGPSALPLLTVQGLAGHTARAVTVLETYLDGPQPAEGIPLSAAEYFAAAIDTDDISAPVHVAIRQRGEQEGAVGWAALVETYNTTLGRLGGRLEEEPADRCVSVIGNRVLRLDEYLRTRIVELCVHLDDLCVSAGRETPEPPGVEVAIATLVEVAQVRHGRLAVVRALARRERDHVAALRVL